MKKLFALLLALLICITPAFAAQIPVTTIIDSVTLDADPTSVNSSAVQVADGINKLLFYVNYNETEVGGISAAVTLQLSFDGTNWYAANFFDIAGGVTPQTTESLTADATYVLWTNPDVAAPYYRVVVTATGSDADDTAVIIAKVAQKP